MKEWKKVKIKDFLTERSEHYKPNDNRITKYKRLDKIDFSGMIQISTKPTKTNMILVQPGDLVISGINVAKGALAVYQGTEPIVATIHYSSYIFDDSLIDLDYFKFFVKSPAFMEILKKQVKGGIKTEIKPKHFLPLEIFIPDLQTQKEIVKKVSANLERAEKLIEEIQKQKSYVKQLRQNILQEAIEGKLTADWRKTHPVVKGNPDFDAESLFEKIQEEKCHTDSLGKKNCHADSELLRNSQKCVSLSRKQTVSLSGLTRQSISENETPFEIPDGWKWVRLGEIGTLAGGKRLPPGENFANEKTNHVYIRIKDMKNDSVELNDLKYINDNLAEKLKKYCIYKDELYITIAGTIGQVGIIPPCLAWDEFDRKFF